MSWLMTEKHINTYPQNSVTLTLDSSFTGLYPAVNSSATMAFCIPSYLKKKKL